MQPRKPPLLSLLIPTKNRYETLVPIVREIAGRVGDDRLEIVVCDNSSVRELEGIEQLADADPRISYHNVEGNISIVDNTERGIALCRGEYLCFIGDDDLVSPHIMGVVDWLKRQDGDCLIYPPARYWWSSVRFAKESRYQRPGVFWLPKDRDGGVERLDSATELDAVLARGGVGYMNLPRLYHGIASRRSVERILEKFGRSVPGSSPDMALSIALALTNERYLSIDYPVTVFGASRNSGGGLTAARQHHGRIEDQKHMPRDMIDNWDPRLPRIFSEQIIHPQTIHEVMSRAGRASGLSYPTLYGSLLAYEPHIFGHLWPILARRFVERPADLAPIVLKTALKVAGRVRTSIRSRTGAGMPFDLHAFPDVTAAMEFMAGLPPPAIAA